LDHQLCGRLCRHQQISQKQERGFDGYSIGLLVAGFDGWGVKQGNNTTVIGNMGAVILSKSSVAHSKSSVIHKNSSVAHSKSSVIHKNSSVAHSKSSVVH